MVKKVSTPPSKKELVAPEFGRAKKRNVPIIVMHLDYPIMNPKYLKGHGNDRLEESNDESIKRVSIMEPGKQYYITNGGNSGVWLDQRSYSRIIN